MVFLVIRTESMGEGQPIPTDLRDFVSPHLWNQICIASNNASSEGHLYACLGEWCICALTGFFCIFCCHPVLAASLNENKFRNELRNLNSQHFSGNPVLSVSTGIGLQINTDLIPTYVHVPISNSPQQFASAVAIPVNHYSIPSDSAPGHVYMQHTSNISNETSMRVMVVTVPQGVYPGAILNVVAPDNTPVQVCTNIDLSV